MSKKTYSLSEQLVDLIYQLHRCHVELRTAHEVGKKGPEELDVRSIINDLNHLVSELRHLTMTYHDEVDDIPF